MPMGGMMPPGPGIPPLMPGMPPGRSGVTNPYCGKLLPPPPPIFTGCGVAIVVALF